MKLVGCLVGVIALGLVSGCTSGEALRGAAAPPEPAAQRSSGWNAPAESYQAPEPSSPSAYPPAAGATADMSKSAEPSSTPRDRAERAPSERPGLGTEWGETRTSHVHDVEFVRASESPYAAASLRYDDRAGVNALASRQHHEWVASRNAREVTTARGAIDVSLRDDHGSAMEMWRVGSQSYVVGHAGERYAIVLHNRTGHRFEVVTTVDGLDVIDGKPGSTGKRGYLIGPYATFAIEGFRQSEDAVAAFRFGRVADSYAAQTGSARDVGVIGAAVFAESGDSFGDEEEARERDTATPFPGDTRYAQPPR